MSAQPEALQLEPSTAPAAPPKTRQGLRGGALALDVLVVLALGLLIAAVHWPLLLANTMLADYDLHVYFYPYWQYRAEAIRAGQLPLWNPYLFTGVPLLANMQVGVFYPPNVVLSWLDAPRAVALSYVGHLWLAAAGMYLLLRHAVQLRALAAIVGALVFALGGFFAAQSGHINQIQAAAWLPWLAWVLHRAFHGGGLWWLPVGALLFGAQLSAGHPQETFLGLSVLGLLVLFEALRNARGHGPAADAWINRRFPQREWWVLRFVTWAAYGGALLGGIAALGAGLAAVQLLPSAELSASSVRAAGLTYDEAVSFSLPPWELLRAFLPTYGHNPLNEFIGYAGIAALVLVTVALRWWRPHPYTLFFSFIFAVGLLLALGGYTPFYYGFYETIPGFNLFRVPARWLFVCVFALSGLAAIGLEHLMSALPEARRGRALLRAGVAMLATLAIVAGIWLLQPLLTFPFRDGVIKWLSFLGLALALSSFGALVLPRRVQGAAWVLLVATELVLARLPLPVANPLPAEAYSSMRPALAHLLQDPSVFRTLSIANPAFDPGDQSELLTALSDRFSDSDNSRYVEALKYRDILSPNLGLRYRIATIDGYDGGILPMRDYVALKQLILEQAQEQEPHQPLRQDAFALIRDQLLAAPSASFLGALNIKYLIADRLGDVWVDGFYHDVSLAQRLSAGQRLVLDRGMDRVLPDGVTALSLVTYLDEAADLAQGAPVATVTLRDIDGSGFSWTLRAGIDTAEANSAALADAAHRPARVAGQLRDQEGRQLYATRIQLARPVFPRSLTIEAQQRNGSLVVAGLTLIDGRTQASASPVIAPGWQRVYTGDVKLYENLQVRERAYVARQATVLPELSDQLKRLPRLGATEVLLAKTPDHPAADSPASPLASSVAVAAKSEVKIERYQPEEVVLRASLSEPGYVVLTDSYYPGWRAFVDGGEVEVLRANYLFRAVAVPAGEHRVEFRYQPERLYLGALISMWSGIAAVTLLLFWPLVRACVRWFRRTGPRKAGA